MVYDIKTMILFILKDVKLYFFFIRELDSGLAESVSTLIWAAPRLQSEVAELKIVSTSSFCNVCRLLFCFIQGLTVLL